MDLQQFREKLLCPLPATAHPHVLEFLWEFPLAVSAAEIWPFLADTSRMNKEMGLAPMNAREQDGKQIIETVMLGQKQIWVEKPWVWVVSQEIQNRRLYEQGWMKEQNGVFVVEPKGDGVNVQLYFRWQFDSLAKKIFFSLLGNILKKNFSAFFTRREALIQQLRKNADFAQLLPSIKSEDMARIEQMKKELGLEKDKNIIRLLEYFFTADDLELDRLHLKLLARKLDIPLNDLFLYSRRLMQAGYLSLSWQMICPHCRGAKDEVAELKNISTKNECATCKIEFDLSQEESVEVVFLATEKLRKISKQIYCAAEPAKKRHIKLFQPLPKIEKVFSLELPEGNYRLRAEGDKKYFSFIVKKDATAQEIFFGIDSEFPVAIEVNSSFRLRVQGNEKSTYFTLEEAWWDKERLHPGEVLSRPEFSGFFSRDHLELGVNINLGQQVLLFTDIVGSTPFYREQGDAKAFLAVQAHYGEIQKIVEAHSGVVVKFIGDAVMAAFLDLKTAFQASLEIHKKFPQNRTDLPLHLRISLHRGPVLCANLNVGLDYFGNTVNRAAKIQKWAGANQVAVLKDIWGELKPEFAAAVQKEELHEDTKLGVDVVVLSV